MKIEPADLACLFKNRDKLKWRDHLSSAEPSAQSFRTHQFSVLNVDFRLIERPELSLLKRLRKVLLDLHAL